MEIKKIIIYNKTDQLDLIQRFLEQLGIIWSLDPGLVFELNLVLEEYISNLICYGYSDKADHKISVELSKEDTRLTMLVTDDGNEFNILELPGNDEIEKPVEERKIGGLGIHFIKTLTDHLEYESDGKKNKLLMVKNLDS
jgi:serine/threonine-protein kinase RsbW